MSLGTESHPGLQPSCDPLEVEPGGNDGVCFVIVVVYFRCVYVTCGAGVCVQNPGDISEQLA